MSKDYYIYILECTNERLYTGVTLDIKKRFNEHVTGKGGAKFTRSFKPKKIAALWKLIDSTRGEALRIEAYIKSLNKEKKIALTKNPESLADNIVSLKNSNCKLTVIDNYTI
ncbi:MAG: GIY-YIG nuclease family protein [Spirochaetes bacterium]|nr:GIY-YIG nuclease family protein [Spirochaetota bacterium]